MNSDFLSPHAWLVQQPVSDGQYLYVVLSNASDARPLVCYYQTAKPNAPIPIWNGTPYFSWKEVMPYLDKLSADSPFLDWIEQNDKPDWGWLAVSEQPPDVVAEHLRGLTQVIMPGGTEVFFRFWDGRHLLPILTHLGAASVEVLPVFERYWINGTAVNSCGGVVREAAPYPWWQVPQELLDKLSEEDPSTLVENWLQRLGEAYPQLYDALPEPNLRLKVTHFARRTPPPQKTFAALLDYLNMELG